MIQPYRRLLILLLATFGLPFSLRSDPDGLSRADSAQLSELRTAAIQLMDVSLPAMDSAARMYLNTAESLQDPYFMADACLILGTARKLLGDYDIALQHYIDAFELADQHHLDRPRSVSLNNIGSIYHLDEEYPQALRYYKMALPGFNHPRLFPKKGQVIYNIAIIFQDLGEVDSALKYYQMGIGHAEQTDDQHTLSDLYNSLGNFHQDREEHSLARHYLKKSLQIARTIGDVNREFYPLLNLGVYATNAEDLTNARTYLTQAYQIAYSSASPDMETDAEKAMADLEKAAGNHRQALSHLQAWGKLFEEQEHATTQLELKNLEEYFKAKEKDIELEAQARLIDEKNARLSLQDRLGFALFFLVVVMATLAFLFWRMGVIQKGHAQTLLRLNREKDNMLHAVAHDLQSPVVNIKGLTDILLHTPDLPTDHQKMLTMINRELDRSDHLVRNLLDLESIESGEMKLSLQPVRINSMVEKISSEYQRLASKKNIAITTQGMDFDLTVQSDPGFLQRIIDNLVSNAVKFSPQNSEINIALQKTTDSVRILIEDHGPGLTEQDKTRLFGRFQRLSAQPTGGEHSVGLGLAITKALVERLKGHIEVLSSPGQGATFAVSLPR